jgi:predicted nucleic acid-binding protein
VVGAEEASVEWALSRDCIADTSLLSNFVITGYAHLLHRLLKGPVFLSPSVLDDQEVVPPLNPLQAEPSSEFLRPLYMSQLPEGDHLKPWAPHIKAFALGRGTVWRPVMPTAGELALAASFRDRRIRAMVRQSCPEARGRVELNVGEGDSAAVAVSRSFTFLGDDQAAVNLVRCLYPEVPVQRTCGLLVHAARRGYIPCREASELFNHRLAEDLNFYISRKETGGTQRLRLACDPPACVWERQ